MKVAIVGSRKIIVSDLENYLKECTEIVSGGAEGIDSCAASYAERNGITLTVFLPDYKRYGRAAPIIRNRKIVDYSDSILAFWDGSSRGTQWVIRYAEKIGKPCTVFVCK